MPEHGLMSDFEAKLGCGLDAGMQGAAHGRKEWGTK